MVNGLKNCNMEKVTDKWFKDHGWEKWDDNSVESDGTI